MNTPMCKEVMFRLCEFVINDVIENVRKDFIEEGFEEETLKDFKDLWKDRLSAMNAIDKVEIKETLNVESIPNQTILKQVIPGKGFLKVLPKPAVRPQVGQVRQLPIPMVQQVRFPNAFNNLGVQNFRPPGYANAVRQSNIYKIIPTNQNNPQVQLFRNLTPIQVRQVLINNQSKLVYVGSQEGQHPQTLTQVRGRGSSHMSLPTIPTASQVNNQNCIRYGNQLQNPNSNNNRFVPRAANYTVYRPVPGMSNQVPQNVIFHRASNVNLPLPANAGIPNMVPRVRYQNSSYNAQQRLNQQILTTNLSGSQLSEIMQFQLPPGTVPNIPSGVGSRPVRRLANTVRYVQSRNVFPIVTVASQGNLNEISQPVNQNNNSPDDINQIDGACDSSDDDVEFMSSSDESDDDNIENQVQGNDSAKELENEEFENTNYVMQNDCEEGEQIENIVDDVDILPGSQTKEDSASDDNNDCTQYDDIQLDSQNKESSTHDDNEEDDKTSLNSDDDISVEEDITELFDSDDFVMCQYEKITKQHPKQKNQLWKIQLRDGFMYLNGKEYVFKTACIEAPFKTYEW